MGASDAQPSIKDRGRDTVLCALDELADPGGRGFVVEGRAPMFVIRRGDAVYGYENVCPHRGMPLDWKPDTFLTVDKTEIICATHGALFRIGDGECVAGPCPGARLTPVPVRVDGGLVMLEA